jgi:phage tail sheath protein FI
MPEYLAPGVYVEETSFRPKTIEGVSTSTAGFVGPARYGPVMGEPELLTSFIEFERFYGGLEPLQLAGEAEPRPNFLAHAVRAFFEEGGRRLYVARIANNAGSAAVTDGGLTLTARFPGAAGNLLVTFTPKLGPNVLRAEADPARRLQGARPMDVVVVTVGPDDEGEEPAFDYRRVALEADGRTTLRAANGNVTELAALDPATTTVRVLTVDVVARRPILRPADPARRFDDPDLFGEFSLDPRDRRSLAAYFKADQPSKRLHLSVPFAVGLAENAPNRDNGIGYATALFGAASDTLAAKELTLAGGTDGAAPRAVHYEGSTGPDPEGLGALEALEDVSIVAAPGYSFGYIDAGDDDKADVRAAQQALIGHAERMRYRIAVLDAPDGAALSEVRAYRGQIDSKHAALYYPWVTIVNPVDGLELHVPPSGSVAGIYARNDVERGVHKAPANEVVRQAVGFETLLTKAQQEVLNPEGVNAFRFFEGRGHRLWGARTATSDGEWKYVNLRRYFNYLEHSIDRGTQVFVFENNGERLWENVRATVYDFLLNEWKSGRLMGLKPEEAFFVKCDRTTMTQNDLDNGRLICLIGVAPLRPAEFVIFRIGQKLLETRG